MTQSPLNENPNTLSETPEPVAARVPARPGPANSRHSLLRWAAAGATVLALGAGSAMLASNASVTSAQTNPPAPPTQPGPGGQQQPGGFLLGVMVEDGQNGAVVRRVVPGSAAATAGIQAGDVITAVDGQTVSNAQGLRDRLAGKQVGNTVSLTYTRNGASSTVTATLTAPQFPQGQGQPGQGQGQGGPGRGPGGFGGGFGGFGAFGAFGALQGVAPDQIFSHLLGSQTTVLDASGNRVTFVSTPGKVTAVSANSITIQANDTTRGTVTYTVNGDTKIPGHRAQPAGQNQGQNQNQGQGQFPPAPPTGQPGTQGQGQPGQGQGQGQRPQMTPGSITDFQVGASVVVVSDAANPTIAKSVMGHQQGR